MIVFDHNNMAPALTSNTPTKVLNHAHNVRCIDDRQNVSHEKWQSPSTKSRINNFDLAGLDGQGHAEFGPNGKALLDRFADVLKRLFARLTLTDTAGYGRTLSDPDAVFVLNQSYRISHFDTL
jgi:hypothetical protein